MRVRRSEAYALQLHGLSAPGLIIKSLISVDPEKEDSFGVNPDKEFIWGDRLPMIHQGPKI